MRAARFRAGRRIRALVVTPASFIVLVPAVVALLLGALPPAAATAATTAAATTPAVTATAATTAAATAPAATTAAAEATAVTASASATTAARPALAAGAALPPRGSYGARPIPKAAVLLTTGQSTYPSATSVLAASSGAYVFESEPRGGDGQLEPTPTFDAVVWQDPSKVLTLALPTTGTVVTNPAADVSVAGSTVSVLEHGVSHPNRLWVFTENLRTGSTVTTALPTGYLWRGASRDGYLATVTTGPPGHPATTVLDLPQHGAPVEIGKAPITGYAIHLFAGPNAVAAEYWAKPETIIEYTGYKKGSSWQRLSVASGSYWSCSSITAYWLGCYSIAGTGTNASTSIYDFSLNERVSIEPPPLRGTYEDLRVLPTANAIFWSYCRPSGCTLVRMLDDSKQPSTFAIPGPDVLASDQQAFWGIASPGTDPSSAGILSVSETGTGALQIEQAPLSPIAASAVSVTGGTQPSVAYVDNAAAGLGVWRSLVTEQAGQPPVVGEAVQAGSVGFAAPSGPVSGVSLSDGATAVAYSTDDSSGTGATVGLEVASQSGSGPVVVTPTAQEGNDVAVWGRWVSWLDNGVCHLYDIADGQTITPALSRLAGCAVGAGQLAFIGHGGGVYVLHMTGSGPKPVSDALQVAGPRRGLAVTGVGELFLAVGWVGWDFSYTAPAVSGGPGTESAYRSFTTMQPADLLPPGQYVEGLSGTYVALAWTAGVFPTVRNLSTRSVIHLGPTESSMGLAGNLVTWVGPGGLAWLYELPG